MVDRPFYLDREGKINLLQMEDRLDLYSRPLNEKNPSKEDCEYVFENLYQLLTELKEFVVEAQRYSIFQPSPYWQDYLRLTAQIAFLIGKCKLILEEYDEIRKWIVLGAEVSPGYDTRTAIYYDAILHKVALKTKEPCRFSLLDNSHSLIQDYDYKYRIFIENTE
ncbi:MAG: hypothetical protein U9Q88_14395 [Bacillota bacterium]|nr:hypothetical protein [Bacillota bacterium]